MATDKPLPSMSLNGFDRWRALAEHIADGETRGIVRRIIDAGARNAYDTICVEHARPFTDWEWMFEGSMVTLMSHGEWREPGTAKDSARDWFVRNGLPI